MRPARGVRAAASGSGLRDYQQVDALCRGAERSITRAGAGGTVCTGSDAGQGAGRAVSRGVPGYQSGAGANAKLAGGHAVDHDPMQGELCDA